MADGKFIEVALEVSQIEFRKMENGYAINVKRIIFYLRWVKEKAVKYTRMDVRILQVKIIVE